GGAERQRVAGVTGQGVVGDGEAGDRSVEVLDGDPVLVRVVDRVVRDRHRAGDVVLGRGAGVGVEGHVRVVRRVRGVHAIDHAVGQSEAYHVSYEDAAGTDVLDFIVAD